MSTKQDFLSNAAWVKRVGELFSATDVNKNGFVKRADFQAFVDNLEKLTQNERPDLIKKAREVVMEFADSLGVKEGVKLTKEEYIEGMAALAVEQSAKLKRGETSLTVKLNNAFYDVVDVNHDGTISLEEYKLILKAFNIDESAAAEGYATLDKNQDGKLNRQKMNEAETNFWWSLDDPASKGMMGKQFEI